jgi:hypothetical protein
MMSFLSKLWRALNVSAADVLDVTLPTCKEIIVLFASHQVIFMTVRLQSIAFERTADCLHDIKGN